MLAAAVALLFFFWSDQFLAPPDCAFYWAWADAIQDSSLNFLPAFHSLEIPAWYGYITETGYLANDWPMGTGLLILPAASAGPIWAHAWLMLLLILALAYWWRTIPSAPVTKAVCLGGMVVGTPLLFYGLFGPFFSHIASFIVVTGFLVSWARSHDEGSSYRWLHLGLLLGLATLVRPQNILLAIVFLADAPQLYRYVRTNPLASIHNIMLPAILGLVLGLGPRFPAYATLYGNAFALPKLEEMQWFRPHVVLTLLSDYHGILPWTPIYAVAVAGLIYGLRLQRKLCAGLLLVFAVQFYINAANQVWWSGGSFGNRRLTDYSIVVAWGLFFLLSASNRVLRWTSFVIALLCALWTFTLDLAERRLILPLDRYIPFSADDFLSRLAGVYLQLPATWQSVTRSLNTDTLSRAAAATILFAGIGLMLTLTQKEKRRARLTRTGRLLLFASPVILIAWVTVAAVQTEPLPSNVQAQFGRSSTILWDNYTELAGYYLVRKEYAEANRAAEKAIPIRKDAPAAYWFSGIALFQLGRFDQAGERLQEVIRLNPRHAGAKELLAQLHGLKSLSTSTANEKPADSTEANWRVP